MRTGIESICNNIVDGVVESELQVNLEIGSSTLQSLLTIIDAF